jgi:hypothetical protein
MHAHLQQMFVPAIGKILRSQATLQPKMVDQYLRPYKCKGGKALLSKSLVPKHQLLY